MNGSNVGSIPVAFYTVTVRGLSDTIQATATTAQVNAEKEVKEGKYRIQRIPEGVAKPINNKGSEISNHFQKYGIQLGKGLFGIPLAILPKFKMELDAMIQERSLMVAKLAELSETGELARLVIANAGKCSDEVASKIPSPLEIRESYSVEVNVKVDFNDAGCAKAMQVMSDELKNQLRSEVEESAKRESADQMSAINGKIVDAVRDLVKDINDRCSRADKGTQWKTMVDKVKKIVEVLPAYNVLGNPELDNMIKSVSEKFGKLTSDDLKDSAVVRAETIAGAKQIATSFANMF